MSAFEKATLDLLDKMVDSTIRRWVDHFQALLNLTPEECEKLRVRIKSGDFKLGPDPD